MLPALVSTAALPGRVRSSQGPRTVLRADASPSARARAGIAGAGKRAPSRAHSDPVDVERPKDEAKRQPARSRALVIGCGALARELVEVTATLPGVDVACLSPDPGCCSRPDPRGAPRRLRPNLRRVCGLRDRRAS